MVAEGNPDAFIVGQNCVGKYYMNVNDFER